MNDYIIEPAKTEDYESILELYNELHEVLEECNPQKFRKIEKTEILITKEYFEKALQCQDDKMPCCYRVHSV